MAERLIRGLPMVARKVASLPPGHRVPPAVFDWLRPRVERAIAQLASERDTHGDTPPPNGAP